MARFVFVTWDGGGNVPPAFGVAQALVASGHEVVVAGQELEDGAGVVTAEGRHTLRARSDARGLPFVLLERSTAAWAAARPDQRSPALIMAQAGNIEDVSGVLEAQRPDVVVVDCLMFGALTAVERAGNVAASFVHSAPGLLMPPGGPFEGFLLPAVNELRTRAGLRTVPRLWDTWSQFSSLCTTIEAFDPLAAEAPSSFEFIGPVFERVAPSGWQSPWPSDDPRPLVLISFASTAAWDQRSRIQRALDALGDGRYRLLVTSSRMDVANLSVPDDAVVVPHIPHQEVLPHVTVMVSHAGHGSVATALAHGVPLVCLPNPVADQPGIAAQVEALGAGRALDGEAASPGEIGAAVRQVVETPSYADAARRIATLIAKTDGAASAATALESLAVRARGEGGAR